MRRRNKTGGTERKTQRPKTLKRHNTPKTARHRNFSAAEQISALTRELKEALEQQTATSEVLKVISSSPGELEPVFNAMLENAVRICAARFGTLILFDDDAYRRAALYNAPAAFVEQQAKDPLPLSASPTLTRVVKTKKVVHVLDMLEEHPEEPIAKFGGARTVLSVPMMRDNRVAGAFSIYRQEIRPFTDKQIELVQNFAAQAVIAIENTRLLNELRESLQQQTATSEVLKVISSSPGELDPVFNAMLENAVRICAAKFGNLLLVEGDAFRHVALHGAPQAYLEKRRREPVIRARPGSDLDRVRRTKQIVQIADMKMEDAATPAIIELAGARTTVAVPMLKDSELVGAIIIYRQEVKAFTEKQIELVKNFAAQAVVAIENTRLLNELRESLQQQTATADVLKVISRSTFDLQAVFKALIDSAAQLCRAEMANIALLKEDGFEYHAAYGFEPDYMAQLRSYNLKADRGSVIGRATLEAKIVHLHDVLADPEYATGPGERWRLDAQKRGGFRTALGVPLLREGKPIGAMFLARDTVEPFTQQQIDLVTTFAAQAVIAIENTRLLNELRQRTDDLSESLEQQTATSAVLKVISSSPSELEPVFQAMLENATRICHAKFGTLYLRETDSFRAVAIHNAPSAYVHARKGKQVRPPPDSALGQVAATRQVAQIADATKLKSYIEGIPYAVSAAELGGYRTIAAVPMLKDNDLVGAILIYRQEVRPFNEKQIALLQNFAAQAVIAIENARLLNDLNKLNQQLEQRVTDQVSEIERMGRLRRFLSPQVADLIVASGAEKQLESHRREITALFCDLRGFSGFSESADPEDVMALLRDYHAALGEIIIKYSGTLERYAGDGVMVVFNDPVPVQTSLLKRSLLLRTRVCSKSYASVHSP